MIRTFVCSQKLSQKGQSYWERIFIHLPDGTHQLQITASRGDDDGKGPSGVLVDDISVWKCDKYSKMSIQFCARSAQSNYFLCNWFTSVHLLQNKTAFGAGPGRNTWDHLMLPCTN